MSKPPTVHRFGNDLIAAHLIVDEDGVTVVDAGLPGHWSAFLRALRAERLGLSDVRGVVLTHGDTDHVGFSERLRAATGVPVYVAAADAARALGEKPPATAPEPKRLIPTTAFYAYAISRGVLRIPPLQDITEVADGDVLDLPGHPVVMALPGHSPGSIGVHVPTARTIFVGDALTTRSVITGATGPRPAPFTDDPAAAAASVDLLRTLDIDRVVPGHGPWWTGSAEALVEAYHHAAATL